MRANYTNAHYMSESLLPHAQGSKIISVSLVGYVLQVGGGGRGVVSRCQISP